MHRAVSRLPSRPSLFSSHHRANSSCFVAQTRLQSDLVLRISIIGKKDNCPLCDGAKTAVSLLAGRLKQGAALGVGGDGNTVALEQFSLESQFCDYRDIGRLELEYEIPVVEVDGEVILKHRVSQWGLERKLRELVARRYPPPH